jgi:AcrR family transcriptional regulator
MPGRTENIRKTRILDAAERAFADSGFAGASLRRIVQEAGVNLATVYYYFDSKKGLMQAVFKRRFGPLRQEQLELLRRYETGAASGPLPLAKVLEAMLTPVLRATAGNSARSRITMRLIGRIVSEPNRMTQELLHKQHHEVRTAFLQAMRRSLPRIPLADLSWRIEFVWGALAFTLANPHKILKDTAGICDPRDTRQVLPQMTAFFSAGLRASATAGILQSSAPNL